MSNNEALAQIAYNALQSQLQLALEGFQYKNTLLQQRLSTQMSIDSEYYGRYKDVLAQINSENQFKYQQERDRIADAQWQKQYNLSVANSKKGSSSSSKKSSSSGTEVSMANPNQKAIPTVQEIISNVKTLQGPNLKNNIKDGISGKTFSSMDALLNYYGYAATS